MLCSSTVYCSGAPAGDLLACSFACRPLPATASFRLAAAKEVLSSAALTSARRRVVGEWLGAGRVWCVLAGPA